MVCSNCGAELPDDANYCLNCGNPQKAEVPAQVEEPTWEMCEIETVLGKKKFFSDQYYYNAKAIGLKGVYSAGRSEANEYSGHVSTPKNEKLLQVLIEKLVADGWEPLGKVGNTIYDYRFRRRVK